jgi:hypothetical protein
MNKMNRFDFDANTIEMQWYMLARSKQFLGFFVYTR